MFFCSLVNLMQIIVWVMLGAVLGSLGTVLGSLGAVPRVETLKSSPSQWKAS